MNRQDDAKQVRELAKMLTGLLSATNESPSALLNRIAADYIDRDDGPRFTLCQDCEACKLAFRGYYCCRHALDIHPKKSDEQPILFLDRRFKYDTDFETGCCEVIPKSVNEAHHE